MNNDITFIKDWLPPIIIAASIIAAGIIIQRLIIVYMHRRAKKARWKGGLVIISSLRGTVILISVIVGIYLGLSESPLPENVMREVEKLHKVLVIFLITFIVARLLTGMLRAYTSREEGLKRSISLFKTIISIVVYCIGLLIILESLGISITPLITALGVGGLAVALALQDTLTNLFSGIQITAAHIIKPGNYVTLSTGEEGTVTDITWRYTTLLTQSDNLIVIPNSKMASSSVTNYSLPARNLSVTLNMGVSYGSDLDKVERVTLEVAEALMKEMGVENGDPTFRYKEFGTSSINFGISLTVHEFTKQYVMRHILIKRLNQRFKEEGIVIPFPPVNTVYVKKESPL
jgi:small-conductance mechanosensitive channel